MQATGLSDFPSVLRRIVFDYLPLEEVLWIWKAARGPYLIKGFWKEINAVTNSRIFDKLVECFTPYGGEVVKNFLDLMVETGTQIGGSFLLHCLNEEIDYDDIDIYVDQTFADKLEIFFWTTFEVTPVICEGGGIRHDYSSDRKSQRLIRGVENFFIPNFDYTKRGTTFQLIILRVPPSEFSRKASFDCTRNTFDGKELCVENLRAIRNRKFTLTPPRVLDETETSVECGNYSGAISLANLSQEISLYYRWVKYLEKGFTPIVKEPMTLGCIFDRHELKSVDRMVKYLVNNRYACLTHRFFLIQTNRLKLYHNSNIIFAPNIGYGDR